MVKIGTNCIKNTAGLILSSAQTQLIFYRWTDRYFDGLFQPMCRRSQSSAPFSGDPKFPRSLFFRDGPPSCLTTGTIHLGTKQTDVDEWTKNSAAG